MNKFSLLSMMGVIFVLGGCDHYSTKLASLTTSETNFNNVADIAPAAGVGIGAEMNFSDYLANEYKNLAIYEQNIRKDYTAAKYYTGKIEKLKKGQMVYPASFDDFNVQSKNVEGLSSARADLISAMHTYNIPENRYSLAVAQGQYDCWMDQAEDYPDETSPYSCEARFDQAMSSLVAPEYLDSEEEFYEEFFDVL